MEDTTNVDTLGASPTLEPKSGDVSEVIFRHASGAASSLSLLFAILLIITYGTGAAFSAVRVLFFVLISIVHILSLIKFLLKADKPPTRVLFLSSDVHSLSIFVLFTMADLTPILVIVGYVISLAVGALNYFASDVLPLLGQPGGDAIDRVRPLAAHPALAYVPACLEIALIVQLFVIATADLTCINVAAFIGYVFWVVMFNYATNPHHKLVWAAIGSWCIALADRNANSFGPMLATVVDKISVLGTFALSFYK